MQPRLRQVHIDFHTREAIPDIGIRFEPAKFAQTLKAAHVNSINRRTLYFEQRAGRVSLTLPNVTGMQLVELELED